MTMTRREQLQQRSGRMPKTRALTVTGPAGAILPAGDALSSGNPSQTANAGSWDFRTSIQVLGADPQIDAGSFASTLARTMNEVAGGNGMSVTAASIVKGAQQPQSITSTVAHALRTATGSTNDPPSWWITINGRLDTTGGWRLADLNRAIARAFMQVTRFGGFVDPRYSDRVPTDGGPLLNALSAANACTGGRDYTKVFSAACTRYQGAATLGPNVIPPPIDQGSAQTSMPGSTSRPPTSSTAPNPAATCAIRSQSQFWLRPSATFAHTGPNFPAGTAVQITGPRISTRGSLGLYPVRVNSGGVTRDGYAAFNASEMASCSLYAGGGTSSPQNGVVTQRPAPVTTTRPATTTTVARPSAPSYTSALLGNSASSSWTSSPYLWGGIALVGVAALAVILWSRSKMKRSASTQAAHQHRSTRAPAYIARRSR